MKKLITVVALCGLLMNGSALAHADHGVISGQGAINNI